MNKRVLYGAALVGTAVSGAIPATASAVYVHYAASRLVATALDVAAQTRLTSVSDAVGLQASGQTTATQNTDTSQGAVVPAASTASTPSAGKAWHGTYSKPVIAPSLADPRSGLRPFAGR